jgi:hypothetical protein
VARRYLLYIYGPGALIVAGAQVGEKACAKSVRNERRLSASWQAARPKASLAPRCRITVVLLPMRLTSHTQRLVADLRAVQRIEHDGSTSLESMKVR